MKKRIVVLVWTFLLLAFCCVSVGAAGQSPSDAQLIKLNEVISETFQKDEDGEIVDCERYFRFIPSETGYFEVTVRNPIDNNTEIIVRNTVGEEICSTYYNDYTGEQFDLACLNANSVYYLELFCDEERVVEFSVSKHQHSFVTSELDKAEVDSYDSCSGHYSLECKRCDYFKYCEIPKVKTIKLSATRFVYNGKVRKVSLTIKDNKNKSLKAGVDYSFSGVTSAKEIGIYSIKIKFKGNYSGSRTLTWKIVPSKPSNVKATSTVNSVSITWNKAPGATNYIVYGAYNEKLSTVKTNKTVIKDLSSGTQHKFYICAVKKVGGQNCI